MVIFVILDGSAESGHSDSVVFKPLFLLEKFLKLKNAVMAMDE